MHFSSENLGFIWLEKWENERIENEKWMKKWEDRRNFNFHYLGLVGKVEK